MKTNKIERSCQVILSELKSGKFTRLELEFLHKFFSKLDAMTSGMLFLNDKSSEQPTVSKPSGIFVERDFSGKKKPGVEKERLSEKSSEPKKDQTAGWFDVIRGGHPADDLEDIDDDGVVDELILEEEDFERDIYGSEL